MIILVRSFKLLIQKPPIFVGLTSTVLSMAIDKLILIDSNLDINFSRSRVSESVAYFVAVFILLGLAGFASLHDHGNMATISLTYSGAERLQLKTSPRIMLNFFGTRFGLYSCRLVHIVFNR